MPMHPLHAALVAAAHGDFPPIDGLVDVVAPMQEGMPVVHEFTGPAVVLTDRDPAGLRALGIDGFGAVVQPEVLRWLAGPNGLVGSHDAVLVARGRGVSSGVPPERTDLFDHPRVQRSRHYRPDVRVFGDDRGLITLGHGLVGRLELSVELLTAPAGVGVGGELIAAGLDLAPAGELVWAQVAPGNAASLRAFLRSGFIPIGAETLIEPEVTSGPGPDVTLAP